MAVVAVVAMVATGFAVTQLTAADGAETPDAAVQALFDAVGDEDALGVLEALAPSEREVLVPSVAELKDELARVDVAGDVDLAKVGGVDVEVTGLELRTQGLHPDVAAVKVTGGDIAVSATLRNLPLGDTLLGALEEEGGADLDEELQASEPMDLTLVTVRSGDGWHVSLLYSLAEAARAEGGDPLPDFGNGIPAVGADSPKGAVDAMVAAFNEQDVERMIELTPPDSMAVLHDYGPAWVDDDQDDADEDDEDDDFGFRLEDVEVGEPEGSGDTRNLSLEGYRYVSSWGGEEDDVLVYDDGCLTSTYSYGFDIENDMPSDDEGPSPSVPEPESDTQCVGDDAGGMFSFAALFPPLGPLLFGPGEADIVVVERGGAWYVDPARTILDTMLLNLSASSPERTEEMVRGWAAWLSDDEDAMLATMGAGFYERCPAVEAPADGASFEERKEAGRRCQAELDERWMDLGEDPPDPEEHPCDDLAGQETYETCLEDGADDGSGTEAADPEQRCYESSGDGADIERCLLELGDPDAVADFHQAQCYETSDDDVDAIAACLQELADNGEIGADVVAEFRCSAVYDDLASDLPAEEYEAAGEVFAECMVAAGAADPDDEPEGGMEITTNEPGAAPGGRGSTSTTVIGPSTTR